MSREGFIQKWLERAKIHVDAFSAVCPPDVLYLFYRFCFSLFLSLSSSSRPRIERIVCIRRRFFLAPPFFSRGVVLYSLFGALEVPSVRSDVFFLQVVFTRHFRLFDLCKYLRQSSSFCQTLFAAFVFTRLISFPRQILPFSKTFPPKRLLRLTAAFLFAL